MSFGWRVFAVVLLLFALATAGRTAGTDDPAAPLSKNWKRTGSGDIEVVGPVSDDTLRATFQDTQAFRELFAALYPGIRVTWAAPTQVVVFPNPDALVRYTRRSSRGGARLGGYFASGPDLNLVVLGGSSREILYHEFAHTLVLRNLHSLPPWLSEGLADFYSTFEVNRKKGLVILGLPPEERLRSLRQFAYVPIKRIVQASPGAVSALWRRPEGIAIQYAESWGLVHYLLLERKDRNPGAFGRFLTAVEAGSDPTRALEEAYATTLAGLDAELKPYLTQRLTYRALSVPIAAAAPAAVQATPMTEADARYVQGRLLLRAGSTEDAQKEFDTAIKLDPSHVGTNIGAALVKMDQQQGAEAVALLRDVAAANPTSFAAQYYLGTALAGEWRHPEAVAAYSRAIALNGASADAWIGLSVAALASGQLAGADAAMAHAVAIESDPRLYRARAEEALAIGADAVAARDARRYLDAVGMDTEGAVYTALVGAIAHLRLSERDHAHELLTAARDAASPWPWTVNVVDFIDSRLPAEEFLRRAKTDGEKTEAHAYLGFRAQTDGRLDEAVTHFQWVADHGDRIYSEYSMARRQLTRLKH